MGSALLPLNIMKRNYLYIIKIDGMRCGSCEAHVNNLIRKNFDIKKVKSSHLFNKTKIYSNDKLDEEKIKTIMSDEGYEIKNIEVVSK